MPRRSRTFVLSKKKKLSKLKSYLFWAIIGLTVLLIMKNWFATELAWTMKWLKATFIGFLMFLFGILNLKLVNYFREQNRIKSTHKALQKELSELNISTRRADYIIENSDYRRGNPKENIYRKMFLLSLLEVFGNKCAKCGSQENGVDIDHFFMSKNEGGCFIMRHSKGYLINNAIPLCQSCNRKKSDKSFMDFFTPEESLNLLQYNAIMTKKINAIKIDLIKPV